MHPSHIKLLLKRVKKKLGNNSWKLLHPILNIDEMSDVFTPNLDQVHLTFCLNMKE